MNKRLITSQLMRNFETQLRVDEKSDLTVEKYLRDIRQFATYADGREVDKPRLLEYKAILEKKCAITSANSKIAAINSFLRFAGWQELCLRQFRVQKKIYCPEEKEISKAEYLRLVETAKRRGNERLELLLQTICGTGIRVSEVKHITAEAVICGEAVVHCKGKTRVVIIVRALQKRLLKYCRARGIKSGSVFVTSSGRPLNRTNIWREMKSLCKEAGVAAGKVFPHNLRHLFARVFYGIEKDIVKLADVLGHSSINTTRIYVMTTGAEHRRKMESMRLIL
ncbi:MAG: tyrosine-type recombinase/integrase [Clostridia bacterium]|nr:tyrosine-type recombinase/integrase [Clostridia bacterium]